ncbi:Pentatricopeptide repeat domain [Dermatophagoides pteronyssinus]|uniref:Small ribosomal subunit protein mS39 n=1 Tax=Dermatophagoides pteronyssinus TaxID=6956 RepID=A0ABQ8IX44_DERPT|nr:Pentatricopeptide repeat domain [Dermatophagoides pteronyssinus]
MQSLIASKILSFQNVLRIGHLNKRLMVSVAKNKKSLEEIIKIPKAIPRGPTDILKALSSTIEQDNTGPSYQYIDDPYLTPVNNVDKRTYSISKESGRKTARYFIEKFPELFIRDMSEPKIEAFTHKEIYDESMEFSENDLQKSILRCEVINSIICYEKLMKDGISIDPEIIYDLLDLVCFFNSENEKEHYIEEDFFQKNAKKQNITVWKDNGFAEKLFDSIEPKNDRVYSSIIKGMAKHNQCERAFSLYQQAIDLNFKLNTATYNSLINISNELHSTNEERWKTVIDLLKTMNQNQIAPDIGTLNGVLKQISKYKFFVQSNELILKSLNEFAFKFDIRPSFGTYYHLLSCFYRSRNSKSTIIYEIIDKIGDEKFEPQDMDDVYFFATAMDIASNLNDVQLAFKIDKIANRHLNLLGPNSSQNVYYYKFLKLLCLSESIEQFMAFYNRYVPHMYSPNVDLMANLLKTIKIYKAINYLPQIYDDIRLLYYIYNMDILQDLLLAMDEIQQSDPLLSKFNQIVIDVFNKINLKISKNIEMGYDQSLQWTGKTLSLCLSILNKCKDLDMGYTIMEKMYSLRNELYDQPESKTLADFAQLSFQNKRYDYVLFCLKLCQEFGKQDAIDLIRQEFEKSEINIQDENLR